MTRTPTTKSSGRIQSANTKSARAKSASAKSARVKSGSTKLTKSKSGSAKLAKGKSASTKPARIKPASTKLARIKPTNTSSSRAMPDFSHEEALRARGLWPVAGCDEVGRGPLAGPVVAAAVILDPARIPDGIDDSKKLSPARREKLFAAICEMAHVSLAMVPASVIDRDNIRAASLSALARAVRGLYQAPRFVLVDGRDAIDAGCACQPIIGGDRISLSIAAASIIAKVARDRLMTELARHYPAYGFERHMGYGVPAHLAALQQYGPTAHHRLSFAPVMQAAAALRSRAIPSITGQPLPSPELPG